MTRTLLVARTVTQLVALLALGYGVWYGVLELEAAAVALATYAILLTVSLPRGDVGISQPPDVERLEEMYVRDELSLLEFEARVARALEAEAGTPSAESAFERLREDEEDEEMPGAVIRGPLVSRPSASAARVYFATDFARVYVSDGTTWTEQSPFVIGESVIGEDVVGGQSSDHSPGTAIDDPWPAQYPPAQYPQRFPALREIVDSPPPPKKPARPTYHEH